MYCAIQAQIKFPGTQNIFAGWVSTPLKILSRRSTSPRHLVVPETHTLRFLANIINKITRLLISLACAGLNPVAGKSNFDPLSVSISLSSQSQGVPCYKDRSKGKICTPKWRSNLVSCSEIGIMWGFFGRELLARIVLNIV